jgi:perosamine synthetase
MEKQEVAANKIMVPTIEKDYGFLPQSKSRREKPLPFHHRTEAGLKPAAPVCNLRITKREIFGKTAPNNYQAWFAGAKVFYVHTARTAIHRAWTLLNLRIGDEILVPAYNCGSEVDALVQAGARVRLYRVSLTGEIDIEDLQGRITSASKAIYAIHYFGFPQELSPLADICHTKGLYLIEDCALSSLTNINGRRIGCTGDVAIYNFPKFLPVPDGGALVVNNPVLKNSSWPLQSPGFFVVLSNLLRLLRQNVLRHMPRSTVRLLNSFKPAARSESNTSSGRLGIPQSYYYNPAMSNRAWSKTSAWLMHRIDLSEVRRCRRQNYSHLVEFLAQSPDLKLPFQELPEGVCPLCLPVIVPGARQVANRLRLQSVPAIAWWAGYHRDSLNWSDFPEACYLKENLLALAIHQQLDETAISFIGQKVLESLAEASVERE